MVVIAPIRLDLNYYNLGLSKMFLFWTINAFGKAFKRECIYNVKGNR